MSIVQNLGLAPLVSVVRGSGKPEGKIIAVQALKELTADTVCQPLLVEKGAVSDGVAL